MTKEEFNIQDERLLGQFFEKERSKVLIVLRNRLSISTEDAEDIYDLWKNGAKNMVTFPEEPRPLAVKRTISHRRWLNGEKTDFTKF